MVDRIGDDFEFCVFSNGVASILIDGVNGEGATGNGEIIENHKIDGFLEGHFINISRYDVTRCLQ